LRAIYPDERPPSLPGKMERDFDFSGLPRP
jgi:hypothetical protein